MNQLLKIVKDTEQDFEWYPTTDAMLAAVVRHHERKESSRHWDSSKKTVLDIGAGDGRVLMYFKKHEMAEEDGLYAIEVSEPLRAVLDPSIFVVGTDFFQQSLWDKQAEVTFCNPPYSHYGKWVAKILRESISPRVYVVIPKRWRGDKDIQDALRDRGDVDVEVVGEFDFLDAERAARAQVEIVFFDNRRKRGESDPFEVFFDEYFSEIAEKFEDPIPKADKEKAEEEAERERRQVVGGKNLVERLVTAYGEEQERIIDAYKKIGGIDRAILEEVGIDRAKLVEILRHKVVSLKKTYWALLFENFEGLTTRLTAKTRHAMMTRLNAETLVDFTASNAYAVVVWAVKQVNEYMDQQLIEVFESLVGADSACAYKSNKKLFVDNRWRYEFGERATHFYLDYRIVSDRSGGLPVGEFVFGREAEINLTDRAYDTISDILTAAHNLGFVGLEGQTPHRKWGRGAEFFRMADGKTELLKVRAFKNQNLHLNLNQDLMLALNVEYGRLKGWLTSPEEAAEELQEPKALAMFKRHAYLGASNVPLLAARNGDGE